MNKLEIYTMEGHPLEENLEKWANSSGIIRSILPANQPISPSDFVREMSILIAPLDLIPYPNEADEWVLTAILKRKEFGIYIQSSQWEDGKALWLPEKQRVYCPWPMVAAQMSEIRDDLGVSTDSVSVDASIARGVKEEDRHSFRSIHPFELVPPPGFNSIGMVCSKSAPQLRRQLLSFHDEATAIATNLERKLAHRLSREFSDVGVICFQDPKDRFHLSICVLNEGEVQRFKTIQNSWIGLHQSCLNFFGLTA